MPECDENSDSDEVPILAPVIVPITVLTGFLGSGKTTLLHHILTEAQTMRIAVVLNEFSGLTKMEKGLSLRSSEMGNDEWIEMPNGCMCCVAKDRAIQAVEQVVAKKVIDHVVIEASGTSDPGPIISMFWQEDESVSNVQLQGIVCVIDGSAFLETKEKFPVVKRQLQHADVILINKCDLASSSQRAAIIYEVKTINGFARVEETSHCNIELAHILQINSMERRFMVSEKTFEEAHHSVPSGFGNVIIKDLETRMKNLESLHKFIQSLLWVETSDFSVIRLKGLFSIAENSESNSLVRMYIVQAVGQTYECTPSLDAETSENGGVTLLVIGENITHSLILKYMSAYVM